MAIMKPDLEQTAAQSQTGTMLQISTKRARGERESEREQESSTEASPPTARYEARSTKTDICIQQTEWARQQAKRKPHSADGTSRNAKFKSVGTAPRVQCKREASRKRRAIAADRSANDIAKQVTMPRERKSPAHVKGSSV